MSKITLGLCCKVLSLSTQLKTTTYKCYIAKPNNKDFLSNLINYNLNVCYEHLSFCVEKEIKAFRISSSMFPIITYPPGLDIEKLPFKDLRNEVLIRISNLIKQNNILICMHPEFYTNIASPKDSVFQKSILDLELHSWFLDKLNLPQNHSVPINIHVNSQGDPSEISQRVKSRLKHLSSGVRNRLVFETEDKGIWNVELLYKYFYLDLGIPITFDFLHNKCNPSSLNERDAFFLSTSTWNDLLPYTHYAESKQGNNPRAHADYCNSLPPDYGIDYWCDIESKAKELDLLLLLEKQKDYLKITL